MTTLSRREPVSWFTAGTGTALVFAAVLRSLVSDRAWLVGLLLLGVAVLVLGVWVALVRRTGEVPERAVSVVDIERRQVRSHRAGPRTPLEQVVRHEPREYPAVSDPNATTREVPSHREVLEYAATKVLPAVRGEWSR